MGINGSTPALLGLGATGEGEVPSNGVVADNGAVDLANV
jgi:hypothetical protein